MMRRIKRNQSPSGQALLILVLVMAVALTIGLAVVSRSVTNIRISTEQEESARVFSVAEAGIEEALLNLPSATLNLEIGGITAVVEPIDDSSMVGGSQEYVFPQEIEADNTQTIWLVNHNESGEPDPSEGRYQSSSDEIRVCWGNEGNDEYPALEATVFYRINNNYRTKKFALDSRAGPRGNSFENPDRINGCTLAGKEMQYRHDLDLPDLPGANDAYFALRLKFLYNTTSQLLGVRGRGDDIPVQGRCYESTATDTSTGLTRKVRHCQPFKAPPGVFDYALYSTNNLEKTGL